MDQSGRHYAGAAAINRALRELGGLWSGIAGLYQVPPIRGLEDEAYRWFARNRSRIAPLYRRMQQSR